MIRSRISKINFIVTSTKLVFPLLATDLKEKNTDLVEVNSKVFLYHLCGSSHSPWIKIRSDQVYSLIILIKTPMFVLEHYIICMPAAFFECDSCFSGCAFN